MRPRPDDGDLLSSENLARQALYRFASLCLLDPRRDAWERLSESSARAVAASAAELLRSDSEARARRLAPGELPVAELDPGPAFDRLPSSRGAFLDLYEATFGLLVSGSCPPYETEYIDGKLSFRRSNSLADIAGFYVAFGLEPSESFHERRDHLAVELEFMACLCGLEHHAAECDDAEARTSVCRDAQAKFLCDHLAWWVPTFARLLQVERPGTFYESLGRFLAAWVPAERARLGVDPAGNPVRPTMIERPEACDSCMLSAR